jgi:hypothetical protein
LSRSAFINDEAIAHAAAVSGAVHAGDMTENTASTATAGHALIRLADAMDAQDWSGLAALLAPGFSARYVHTGEVFDRDGFVAINRDYPGSWRFVREDLVDAGDRGVLRARVSDALELTDVVHHVASFATVDETGLLADLVEVWTEEVALAPTARRPAVGGAA